LVTHPIVYAELIGHLLSLLLTIQSICYHRCSSSKGTCGFSPTTRKFKTN